MIPCSLDTGTQNWTGLLVTTSLWQQARMSFLVGLWNSPKFLNIATPITQWSSPIVFDGLTILSPRQKLDWLDHHFCLVKIRILPFAESISPHVSWSNAKKILYESKFLWSESIQIPKVVSFSCLLLKWPKIRMFFFSELFLHSRGQVWRWLTCWNRICLAAWIMGCLPSINWWFRNHPQFP